MDLRNVYYAYLMIIPMILILHSCLFSVLSTLSLLCVCFQLEKVLQQGDIGECAEPYMVFKESDAAKVSMLL